MTCLVANAAAVLVAAMAAIIARVGGRVVGGAGRGVYGRLPQEEACAQAHEGLKTRLKPVFTLTSTSGSAAGVRAGSQDPHLQGLGVGNWEWACRAGTTRTWVIWMSLTARALTRSGGIGSEQ